MTPRARIAIIAIALVGLVVAFVAASGSDDTGTEADREPTPATATQPATTAAEESTGGTTAPAETTPAQTTPAEPEAPLVRFQDGQVVGGIEKISVDKGDTVRFRVRSDVAEEVHIHGYDDYVDLEAGKTKTISFKATIDGRFEIELHGAAQQIVDLEVSTS